MWAEGIALTVSGILHAVSADPDSSQARHSEALEIQRRLGDWEGAGMSLGALAQLASGRGDTAEAIELYRRSLTAFEAVGDRGEEARILARFVVRRAWLRTPQLRALSRRQGNSPICRCLYGPGRDRTCDLGIKSPLLYRLSYRPSC
jgi:hypothetical protein